jgi:hypothetical protein
MVSVLVDDISRPVGAQLVDHGSVDFDQGGQPAKLRQMLVRRGAHPGDGRSLGARVPRDGQPVRSGQMRVEPLFGRSRHGAPDRKTQKMPFSTRRSFTRGTPRGLLGSIGLGSPFAVGEFVAHDSAPSVRGLNHGP